MKLKSKAWILLLVAALLAVTVPVGAAALAQDKPGDPAVSDGPGRPGGAAQRRDHGERIVGQVLSVDGRTIVLEVPFGQLNVVTDGRTRFVVPGVDDPGIGDVAPGTRVAVQGRRLGQRYRAAVVLVIPDDAGRLAGQVLAVGDAGFDLETQEGTVAVLVDGQTRYRLPGVDDPGLDDIAVGMRLTVAGEFQEDDVLRARMVTQPRPPVRSGRGEVLAVGSDSLTVQLPRGEEQTLTVTDETEILVPGVVDPELADIQVGDAVMARVRVEGPEALIALHVAVVPPDAASLLGEVRAVDGATVQVETRLGQVIAVQTDAATVVRIPGVEDAAVADLRAGDRVRVGGAWVDAATFTGWAIQVGKEGRVAEAQGRILALGADTFTLGTPHGAVTVTVDDETRYHLPGVDDPSFADLAVGQRVGVQGLLEADGTLLARRVGARPQE